MKYWITLVTLTLAGLCQAEGYTEFLGANGSVNWSSGKVSAQGFGVAPEGRRKEVADLLACRAAIVNGQRNLLEATKGVRINSETLIENYVAVSDKVRATMEGTIKGASILDKKLKDDGTCKVRMQVSLAGPISQSVYRRQDKDLKEMGNVWPTWPEHWSLFATAHAEEEPVTTPPPWVSALSRLEQRLSRIERRLAKEEPLKQDGSALPSGLIIDARGSNFIPSMSPKLRRLRGEVVYPQAKDKSAILESGQLVSLFARSLDFAMTHPLAGTRPLLVNALRTYGETRTEIVLRSAEAQKIAKLRELDFFDQAGVIIVMD